MCWSGWRRVDIRRYMITQCVLIVRYQLAVRCTQKINAKQQFTLRHRLHDIHAIGMICIPDAVHICCRSERCVTSSCHHARPSEVVAAMPDIMWNTLRLKLCVGANYPARPLRGLALWSRAE